jgi:hypothetical protein
MLTPIQKLDTLLKMFAPKYDGSISSYSYKDIQEISKIDMDNYLNPHEIERILDKLIEDRYIIFRYKKNESNGGAKYK